MAANENDNAILTPMELFIEGFRSENVVVRLKAVGQLSMIALVLGAEKTRLDLLPFLTANLHFDDDECLLAVADQLGSFSQLVGGNEHVTWLLPALEILAQEDEPVVRNAATKSLWKIATNHSAAQLESHYVPMVRRLCSSEWYSGRCSVCGLFAVTYPRVKPELKGILRRLYTALAKDDTPMVRRAAAQQLGEFAAVVGEVAVPHLHTRLCQIPSVRRPQEHNLASPQQPQGNAAKTTTTTTEVAEVVLVAEFLPILAQFSSDDDFSVRTFVSEAAVVFFPAMNEVESDEKIVPFLKSILTDKNWRVRLTLAENLIDLQRVCTQGQRDRHLLNILETLVRDPEAEVRAKAAKKINVFCTAIETASRSKVIVKSIMPLVKEMADSDSSIKVRKSVASILSYVSPMLGREPTMKHVVPLYLALLKDESSEVRLRLIEDFGSINEVIGINTLQASLLPAVVQLAEDVNWRVRKAINGVMSMLASQLGMELFDDKLVNICIGWLTDHVFAVRDAATKNLKVFVEKFGTDWAQNRIIPKVVALGKDPSYLTRMTSLNAIGFLAEALGQEVTSQSFLPILKLLSTDKVPNVRFGVAKCFQKIAPIMDPGTIQSQFKPILDKLKGDVDVDVRDFAMNALEDSRIAQPVGPGRPGTARRGPEMVHN